MYTKNKNNDIPEKISSHNLLILQELNKELENEYVSKESKKKPEILLLQIIFNLLNSQISLIYQISKLNTSNPNNLNLIDHIITFNKDLMIKQIQKIISILNDTKYEFKKNLTTKNGDIFIRNKLRRKKDLNKSFLTNTSFNVKNKTTLRNKFNKKIIVDNDLSLHENYMNCFTQEKENIENNIINKFNKDQKLNSFKEIRDTNIPSTKNIKTIENINLNHNLINFVIKKKNFINKNKTQEKKLNITNKVISLSPLNNKEIFNYDSKDNNNTFEEDENPVRKVKKIIINAKRYISNNKDRYRKNKIIYNNDISNYDNEKKEKNNSPKLSSSDINIQRYKKLYNEFSESFNDIRFNNNIEINYDKNRKVYYMNSNKGIKRDRESRELLQDGMKNIKNRLFLNKLLKN